MFAVLHYYPFLICGAVCVSPLLLHYVNVGNKGFSVLFLVSLKVYQFYLSLCRKSFGAIDILNCFFIFILYFCYFLFCLNLVCFFFFSVWPGKSLDYLFDKWILSICNILFLFIIYFSNISICYYKFFLALLEQHLTDFLCYIFYFQSV